MAQPPRAKTPTQENHPAEASTTLSTMSVLRKGLAAAWPICFGYFPIGVALGVLGQQAGLGPTLIGLMSVLVFAGSAQFIGVAMIDGGASATAIILTTLVVNFRHVLMSSALAVPLRGTGRLFLLLFAYGITDESFAVNMTRFRAGNWDRWRALIVHHAANTTWIVATTAGAAVGTLIPAGSFGIDFALPGMFIALLAMQLHGRAYIFTGLLSALIALVWKLLIPGDSYIVAAAVLAATGGYLMRHHLRQKQKVGA